MTATSLTHSLQGTEESELSTWLHAGSIWLSAHDSLPALTTLVFTGNIVALKKLKYILWHVPWLPLIERLVLLLWENCLYSDRDCLCKVGCSNFDLGLNFVWCTQEVHMRMKMGRPMIHALLPTQQTEHVQSTYIFVLRYSPWVHLMELGHKLDI